MKNQYFGDVNDYRKYGLLRVLLGTGDLTMTVGWMLTPDDGSTDGGMRAYLGAPDCWRHYDELLYRHLSEALSDGADPSLTMLEELSLLPGARYFSEIVPDYRPARLAWGERLLEFASGTDLVFLDPDTGIETRSKPIGRQDSSKYAAWSEIEELWSAGSSLLVYQHYNRLEKRPAMTDRLVTELLQRTGSPCVKPLSTPHVLFLLVAQPRHVEVFGDAIDGPLARWQGQIRVVDPGVL